MFALKIATILAVAAATFAHPALQARDTCSTGTLQCCDSVSPSGSNSDAKFGGFLPIALQGSSLPLGFNCNPFSISGAGSSGTCSTQTACCNGVNNDGGVPIGVDCTPVNTGI